MRLQQWHESTTPAKLTVARRIPDHKVTLAELIKRPDHIRGPR
jgi:hypothetical protein